jgi:hypothetical protein
MPHTVGYARARGVTASACLTVESCAEPRSCGGIGVSSARRLLADWAGSDRDGDLVA